MVDFLCETDLMHVSHTKRLKVGRSVIHILLHLDY